MDGVSASHLFLERFYESTKAALGNSISEMAEGLIRDPFKSIQQIKDCSIPPRIVIEASGLDCNQTPNVVNFACRTYQISPNGLTAFHQLADELIFDHHLFIKLN